MKKIILLMFVAITLFSCEDKTPYEIPSKCIISELKVTKWPTKANGVSWDMFNDADVYFKIEPKGSLLNSFVFNNPINNTVSDLHFLFDYTIYNADFDKDVYIYLMDEDDLAEDELICYGKFKINEVINYQDGDDGLMMKPFDFITIKTANFEAELEVSWTY